VGGSLWRAAQSQSTVTPSLQADGASSGPGQQLAAGSHSLLCHLLLQVKLAYEAILKQEAGYRPPAPGSAPNMKYAEAYWHAHSADGRVPWGKYAGEAGLNPAATATVAFMTTSTAGRQLPWVAAHSVANFR